MCWNNSTTIYAPTTVPSYSSTLTAQCSYLSRLEIRPFNCIPYILTCSLGSNVDHNYNVWPQKICLEYENSVPSYSSTLTPRIKATCMATSGSDIPSSAQTLPSAYIETNLNEISSMNIFAVHNLYTVHNVSSIDCNINDVLFGIYENFKNKNGYISYIQETSETIGVGIKQRGGNIEHGDIGEGVNACENHHQCKFHIHNHKIPILISYDLSCKNNLNENYDLINEYHSLYNHFDFNINKRGRFEVGLISRMECNLTLIMVFYIKLYLFMSFMKIQQISITIPTQVPSYSTTFALCYIRN